MNNTSKMIKKMEELCDVNIDFDGASEAWKNNKKSIGNGSYKYICLVEKNGKKCGKSCYKELVYCWQHRKYNFTKRLAK
jgi:hypothetical protein